jgi:hypothetical protein
MKKLPLLFFCLLLLLPDAFARNQVERTNSFHKVCNPNSVLKYLLSEDADDDDEDEDAGQFTRVSSIISDLSHTIIFEKHSLHLMPPSVEKPITSLFLFNLSLRI